MAEMAVMANIVTCIAMASHPSAVIGRTPLCYKLYLPIRVDNFYYAIEN
jgi:hypothetical protein